MDALAETILHSNIVHNPSSEDISPPTSASAHITSINSTPGEPLRSERPDSSSSRQSTASDLDLEYDSALDSTSDEEEDGEEGEYRGGRGVGRARVPMMPAIPNLRFEQSYMNSISRAQSPWQVALITIKDHIIMPLAQGFGLTLATVGLRIYFAHVRTNGHDWGAWARTWFAGLKESFMGPQTKGRTAWA
ncbi:hypothetical protein SAICODRAFT_18079 [Saitoella complicata NRRL Y-17804]|uniref:DUF1770 domain-containing protein n=1 Tax=Saitoella complicata (strain BCRC 22490 / CBS 7301 / JCM 7358 / NBRC 10748 / NRRL Y-17804) TaxID=698492 RepID=A0A0E9NK68_SAICN|nr:uncharacterized protein SAICODRAFT_18079 [Saitoella complicata NRRL Y-17804]ODQ54550.1 hypothetical protein SAICODRAFT_18079 [Saitoella complicata NRRL Y-17804]GAO50081.1 hypothetical protein G7K_4216-t1 [Saitoella complicata NRRL Y-17804]